MFFSLALLSFEDTHTDILSIDKERDDVFRSDVSISGLESSKMTVTVRKNSNSSKRERERERERE